MTGAIGGDRIMRKIINKASLLIVLILVVGLCSCLLEDREVEIVLNGDTCEDIHEYHTSENYTTPDTLELGADLDELLVENEISKEAIQSAFLSSATYTVTEFEHDHNWELEGVITIVRDDIIGGTPDTLLRYSDLSLEDDLGVTITADLHEDGVAIVNAAIADYLAGATPVLILEVISGDVDPSPEPGDALDFWWKACLNIQVIYLLDTEVYNGLGG
jgi:hypothetical protein